MSSFYDDEIEMLESDEDSDEDLYLDDQQEAELAYLEYEQACALWDNTELPPEVDAVYSTFLEKARTWWWKRSGRQASTSSASSTLQVCTTTEVLPCWPEESEGSQGRNHEMQHLRQR